MVSHRGVGEQNASLPLTTSSVAFRSHFLPDLLSSACLLSDISTQSCSRLNDGMKIFCDDCVRDLPPEQRGTLTFAHFGMLPSCKVLPRKCRHLCGVVDTVSVWWRRENWCVVSGSLPPHVQTSGVDFGGSSFMHGTYLVLTLCSRRELTSHSVLAHIVLSAAS